MPELNSQKLWREADLKKLAGAHQLTCMGKSVSLDLWTTLKMRVVLDGEYAHLEIDNGKGFQRLSSCDWVGLEWCCLDRVVYRLSEEALDFQVPQQIESQKLQRWKTDWAVIGDWKESLTPCLELLHPSGHLARAYHQARTNRKPLVGTSDEQDLLAVGYSRRGLSGDYGTEIPRAQEAIELLASAGWRIRFQDAPVVVQTDAQLTLKEGGRLEGDLLFGTNSVKVQQAWKNPESILCALPNGWGLIGSSAIRPWIKREEGGLRLPKAIIGTDIVGAVSMDPACRHWMGEDVPQEPHAAFCGTLRPYQIEGMRWMLGLAARQAGGLLADEMGLGKTVQVLAALSHFNGQVLIVVPASLLENWHRECQRFLPRWAVIIHHGSERQKEEIGRLDELGSQVCVITTPALVRMDAWLRKHHWNAVILDEAQLLKNHEAATTQAVHQLKGDLRIAMTGTPLENRPEELWTHLSFLDPEMAGERTTFVGLFTHERGRRLLQDSWKGWMRRRRKMDVAQDLPPLLEQELILECEPMQWELHEALRKGEALEQTEADLLLDPEGEAVNRLKTSPMLVRLMRLRQLSCSPALLGFPNQGPKLEQLAEDLRECIEGGGQAVVFSQFVGFLELAAKNCPYQYGMITGKSKNRQAAVDAFQEEKTQVLFCSLKAAGVGLNLQRADLVILLEPWWNRAAEQQAIDRAHRIGRTSPVLVKRYIMAGTVEEKLRILQERKQAWADAWWADQGTLEQEWNEELATLLMSDR